GYRSPDPPRGPVLGIFTERDIVQLNSIGAALKGFAIEQIMIRSVTVVRESQIPDIFALGALVEKIRSATFPSSMMLRNWSGSRTLKVCCN
ncbi:MAG: hypothetical protein HC894_30840, partial [Microcoleus sp. SM1_3_4]|nr:hypothetical protein [Microcoleus sp. SM1_3_4]